MHAIEQLYLPSHWYSPWKLTWHTVFDASIKVEIDFLELFADLIALLLEEGGENGNWSEDTANHLAPIACGVSLRHIALIFSALFLIPITKSSIKRWIDDIGPHLPAPEEMLRQLLALTPVTECPLDGDYPLGTAYCVMVVKDEHNRILLTYEAVSEHGDEARQFLQRLKDCGLKVTAVCLNYSQSFPEAIKAVYPHVRCQADHCHTVKNIWRHLKQSLRSSRRQIKATGAATKDEHLLAFAKQRWQLRWSLLKQPSHVSAEEKQAWQNWQIRMRDLCTASAMLCGNW